MDRDSPDNPKESGKASGAQQARAGSQPAPRQQDLPPHETAAADIDPAMVATDEDDEVLLP
jgi:hypothetical protein